MTPKFTRAALIAGPLLIVGFLADFRVMLLCKGFTDNFAYGHSALKSLGFLVWVTAIGFALRLRLPRPQRTEFMALCAVSLASLMSLMEQVALSQSLGIPPTSRGSVLCLDGAASANSITHMHVSKAPLGWLLWDHLDLTDLGEPFAPFFPDWWLALHLATQLACGGLLLLLVTKLIPNRKWGDALCLVMASYTVLKGLIDGGPFWPEFQVGCLAIVLISRGRRWWPTAVLVAFGFWTYLARLLRLSPSRQRLHRAGTPTFTATQLGPQSPPGGRPGSGIRVVSVWPLLL